MSTHAITDGLFERLALLQEKVRARTDWIFSIVVILEAGLDGLSRSCELHEPTLFIGSDDANCRSGQPRR